MINTKLDESDEMQVTMAGSPKKPQPASEKTQKGTPGKKHSRSPKITQKLSKSTLDVCLTEFAVKSAGHVTLLTLYSAHLALQAEDISGLLQLLDGVSVNSLQLLDAARSLLHLRQEGLRGHKFYTPRLSLP